MDTILICTVTGLFILVTGTWDSGLTGAALSVEAFEAGLPGIWGSYIVTGRPRSGRRLCECPLEWWTAARPTGQVEW